MPAFSRSDASRKRHPAAREAGAARNGSKKNALKRVRGDWDSNIASDDDDSDGGDMGNDYQRERVRDDSSRDDMFTRAPETIDEKRTRLARELIDRVASETRKEDDDQSEDGGSNDQEAEDDDFINQRLSQDVLRHEGKLFVPRADDVRSLLAEDGDGVVSRTTCSSRKHLNAPTASVAISDDETAVYSALKTGSLVAWDTETGQISTIFARHTVERKPILGLAVSPGGALVATCGATDGGIDVWDPREPSKPIRTLTGHRDAATCVAFKLDRSGALYSGSRDRSVRVWSASEGAYIETLYGHQSEVTSIDALSRERVLSCSTDCTLRLWKLPEETHLLLSGRQMGSIDACRMVDEGTFLTGAQDGSLSLWSSTKRRPVSVIQEAHGPGRWIHTVATMRNSDLLASGSDDGYVRVWGLRSNSGIDTEPVTFLPCDGHVTSLAFGSASGRVLVAGYGREPRLGRWNVARQAKNGVAIFRLPSLDASDEEEETDDSSLEDEDDSNEEEEEDEEDDE